MCRRRVLLNYFGERREEDCGNCDNCLQPVETWDGTVAAQKVLSCVYRTGQKFGTAPRRRRAYGEGHAEGEAVQARPALPTFGVGESRGPTEWRSVIRQLIAADLLRVDVDGYGGLYMTEACGPVLKGEEEVLLRKDPAPVQDEKEEKPAQTSALRRLPRSGACSRRCGAGGWSWRASKASPPTSSSHDRTLARDGPFAASK